MRSIVALGTILGLVVSPFVARAQDPQETAAVAGGILAGVGAWAQFRTSSKLEVTVEVFRETEAIGSMPGFPGKVHPRDTRSEPFRLGKRAAASLAAHDPAIAPSAAGLLNVQSQCQPIMDRLGVIAGRVRETTGLLTGADGWSEVLGDFLRVQSALDSALSAWKVFDAAMDEASLDGAFTASELNNAAEHLKAFRDRTARNVDIGPVSQETLEVIALGLWESVGLDSEPQTEEMLTAVKAVSGQRSFVDQMAGLLHKFRQALPPTRTPEQLSAAGDFLAKVGIDLSLGELRQLQSVEALKARLLNDALVFNAVETQLALAYAATYNAGTSSPNIGPILNEVMQVILTQSEYIDIITDKRNEDKWVVLNSASSTGRMGNHSTVIYLENMATPVVKSAKFDPSQFISANAALYQTAFDTSALLFGLPAGQDADNPLAGSNLMTMEKELRKLERVKRKNRLALVQKIGELLTATETSNAANDAGDGN